MAWRRGAEMLPLMLVSGAIFDGAAFANGLAWNALNIGIMLLLLMRARQRLAMA
jgi:hypothetical protein